MSGTEGKTAPSFTGGAVCVLAALFGLMVSATARADTVSLNAGPGWYRFSHDSEVVLLRYERDAVPLFKQAGFWAGSFAAWSGKNRAEAIGLSRGLRWPFGGAWHADAEIGLSWISDTTDNLGTPVQALLRAAIGRRIDSLDVSLGFLHYSNAKWLFGWSGPNNGENFLVLGVGWKFE